MTKVQKWVTLQPNTEYNDFERCFERTQLDVRAIANEIARELSAGTRTTTTTTTTTTSGTRRPRPRPASAPRRSSSGTGERVRSRTLVRSFQSNSRNSLLHRAKPITHERVPEDFVFPEEVNIWISDIWAQQPPKVSLFIQVTQDFDINRRHTSSSSNTGFFGGRSKSILVDASPVSNSISSSSFSSNSRDSGGGGFSFRTSTLSPLSSTRFRTVATSRPTFSPSRRVFSTTHAADNEVLAFRNRLTSEGLVGVSTYACLFNLC